MADPAEAVSVLVALEFVVGGAVVLLLFPIDKTAAILPLFLLLAVALLAYLH